MISVSWNLNKQKQVSFLPISFGFLYHKFCIVRSNLKLFCSSFCTPKFDEKWLQMIVGELCKQSLFHEPRHFQVSTPKILIYVRSLCGHFLMKRFATSNQANEWVRNNLRWLNEWLLHIKALLTAGLSYVLKFWFLFFLSLFFVIAVRWVTRVRIYFSTESCLLFFIRQSISTTVRGSKPSN